MRSRPINVNGILFPSARAAARYIVAEEEKIGHLCKEHTLAKELKRCWSKNGSYSWEMYTKYLVTSGEE